MTSLFMYLFYFLQNVDVALRHMDRKVILSDINSSVFSVVFQFEYWSLYSNFELSRLNDPYFSMSNYLRIG